MSNASKRKWASLWPPALALFFLFATLMVIAAALSLLAPGPLADRFRSIKPNEHQALVAIAPWSGFFFLALAPVMAAAAYGSFRRQRWGWRLAIVVLATNGLGDLIAPLAGAPAASLVGVAVTAAILYGLTRPAARARFATGDRKRAPGAS